MAALAGNVHIVITSNTPVLAGKALITDIDTGDGSIAITVTGTDITNAPSSQGNQITIDPINEPNPVIYSLQFEIADDLQSQWSFFQQAAQFYAIGVQAGLVVNRDDATSVTLNFYNAQAEQLAEYQVSLGFLQSGASSPVWIDDPTIILKPPTDG